jgi:hypothetical protein
MNESIASESAKNNEDEHDIVVRAITESNQKRYPNYKVLNNLGGENVNIAGRFPDVILQDSAGNLLFIIEVRKNGKVAECMQQWKVVTKIPAFLYFVVPEGELSNAKAVAQAIGLQAKFGSYTIDNNKSVTVKYE